MVGAIADTMFYAGEEEAPPSEFRVLYNYVLRNESGVSINFWESSTTLEKLHDFFKVQSRHPRPQFLFVIFSNDDHTHTTHTHT